MSLESGLGTRNSNILKVSWTKGAYYEPRPRNSTVLLQMEALPTHGLLKKPSCLLYLAITVSIP